MGDLYVWGEKDDFFRNRRRKGAEKLRLSDLSLADMKTHFTCGYCYHLAIWLNKVTRLPIYNVMDCHAVVGNGKMFLDITGWQDTNQLKKAWGAEGAIHKWLWKADSPKEFEQWGDFLGIGEELSPKRMRHIVDKVLETYGHEPN